jgi:hypothetical protein
MWGLELYMQRVDFSLWRRIRLGMVPISCEGGIQGPKGLIKKWAFNG